MNWHPFSKRALSLAVLLLTLALPAWGQVQSGNVYGAVLNVDDNTPLPGVTVTLTGTGAPQVQATDAQGRFRFLGLSPGSYSVKAELEGFSPVERTDVAVNIGRNTNLEMRTQPAFQTTIVVKGGPGDVPLLDPRNPSRGQTVTLADLEKTPTVRDPWAVVASTPGVLTDRINVGGSESGQQATYTGPGSGGDQAVWSVDGVVITDMAALGSSPAYYDFDSFEEMQVTTGGTDSTIATGGVVLNMVTKRGTNEWRGSGRYYDTDQKWQSDSSFSNSDLAGRQGLRRRGGRSDRQGPPLDLGLVRPPEGRPADDRRRR
jgi:hypothetical protein